MAQILICGVSGYLGGELAGQLRADGHRVAGFARDPARVQAPLHALHVGDMQTGAGLEPALAQTDVAYYLVHSMERAAGAAFAAREREAAERFAAAAARTGLRRVIYLGGLLPTDAAPSRHLASRLAVEQILMAAVPEPIGLRASIVIGARSRSFRLLVRLIERLPVLALPAWRDNRCAPIDGRDVIAYLSAAATASAARAGRIYDIAGTEVLTYAAMIDRITDALLVGRPTVDLDLTLNALLAPVAAAITGEDSALIEPLFESLAHDLLPRDDAAATAFQGVRRHRFDAAVAHALREWELTEELAAR